MNDGLLPQEDPLVKLEIFEGPLDLLLHLIKQNEVNILDLPMEGLTRQYLATLRTMGKMELPLAGEYFVMAAELLKIKSQMLLPRGQAGAALPSEETINVHAGPDPRAELVRQLLDYQQLKERSRRLEAQIDAQALTYPCLQPTLPQARPLKQLERLELMGSYAGIIRRLLERITVGEIALDPYTVAQAMEYVLARTAEAPKVTLGELLQQGPRAMGWWAAMLVGVLELTRLGELEISQEEAWGEIRLERKTQVAV